MTDTTLRGATAVPDGDDDLVGVEPRTHHRRRRQDTPVEAFFHRTYALFHNKKFGLLLILAMAVFTLIGVLVSQVSPAVRADEVAYAEWLADAHGRFGGWTPIMETLGVFTMFSSIPYLLLVTALALSIIACTTHRLPTMWRKANHPRLHVTDAFFDHAKLHETTQVSLSPADSVGELRALLGKRRFRVLDDPKGDGFSLYADRYRWMPFGTVIAHASFVILLIGFVVSANGGFSMNQPVTVGSRVAIGHGTNLEVEAVSFADTYHATGQPMDYVADLRLYDGGVEVAHQEVRVNTPLRYDGVKIHQAYFGTSTIMTITDAAGAPVFSDGIPLEFTSDDEQHSIGRLEVPGTDLIVFVVTPASGQVMSDIPAGQAQMEVQRAGQEFPVASERLVPGTPVTVEGLTFTLDREAKYTGLMINKDPGSGWIWVGCALMMIGTVLTMGFKHRRIWVRVHPGRDGGSEILAATSDKPDLAYQRWFRDFATDLDRLDAASRGGHDDTDPDTDATVNDRKTRV
ncbi:MAG: cytochrome c biogenesis protein ResB [Mobilicoccus sp.]|nr:cytochrome c biogenesis protein ResB [Mobilicoccus sp.]